MAGRLRMWGNAAAATDSLGTLSLDESACIGERLGTTPDLLRILKTWSTWMGIDDFKGCRPEFLPEDFLDGQLEGWAVLESPVGGLQKRGHDCRRREMGRRQSNSPLYRNLHLR